MKHLMKHIKNYNQSIESDGFIETIRDLCIDIKPVQSANA